MTKERIIERNNDGWWTGGWPSCVNKNQGLGVEMELCFHPTPLELYDCIAEKIPW